MKNQDPSARRARFASTGQRMASIIVLGTFAGLIWLAWSGRFDHEMGAIAKWMQHHYDALLH